MSKITNLVKQIQEENVFVEANEFWESQKVPVSFRLESNHLWRLDFVAEKLDRTRSDLARSFVESASIEAMEALGFPEEEQNEMMLNDMKAKHEAKKAKEESK